MGTKPRSSGKKCYHCGSMETSKRGFHKQKQRYYCRACRRGFRDDPEIRYGKRYRFSPNHKLPSAAHMILELHTIAQRLGRTPTVTDIAMQAQMGRAYTLHTYEAVFGRYGEAIRRAKLTPRYPNIYDRKKMIEELGAFRKKLGRPVRVVDIRRAKNKGELISGIYHFAQAFGTVGKAIQAAEAGWQKETDRWEMIQFLKKLDAKLGRAVSVADILVEYQQGRGPSDHAIEREFGSLQAARRAAGIRLATFSTHDQKKYGLSYTDKELIACLKKFGRELGRRPRYQDLAVASKKGLTANPETYTRRFGSLQAALKKAGFPYRYVRHYTDRQIDAYLRRLTSDLGRFPTTGDMNKAAAGGKGPCAATVIKRFGRISEVKKRFGIEN